MESNSTWQRPEDEQNKSMSFIEIGPQCIHVSAAVGTICSVFQRIISRRVECREGRGIERGEAERREGWGVRVRLIVKMDSTCILTDRHLS